MKVIVFGSQGTVGRALIRQVPKNIELIKANRGDLNLTSQWEVSEFLGSHKPGAIILAAAKVGGIGANTRDHKNFLLENLNIQNATMSAAAALRVPNFVFLGSSCIYPKLANQPINENELLSGPLEPTNEGYAIAKIAGIRLCKAISDQDGLNYFSLMPTNLYGPNDNFDKLSSHVPAALMRKFHEAKLTHEDEVVVWGTGTPRREFMHVDDLARACWYMLNQNVGGELINIGTGEDITIGEFALLMAKVVGYEGNIAYDTSRPDGTPQKLLDVMKAHSYGWKHQIQLEDGLRQTYAWFVEALTKGEVRGY
jgi:GDP-L-fucose synthase